MFRPACPPKFQRRRNSLSLTLRWRDRVTERRGEKFPSRNHSLTHSPTLPLTPSLTHSLSPTPPSCVLFAVPILRGLSTSLLNLCYIIYLRKHLPTCFSHSVRESHPNVQLKIHRADSISYCQSLNE